MPVDAGDGADSAGAVENYEDVDDDDDDDDLVRPTTTLGYYNNYTYRVTK